MNIKMVINSQLLTTESKKLSRQAEQRQNHRCGDHMEGYQLGDGSGRMGEKAHGMRSIIGRYQIDRGRLRIM